MEYGMVLVWLVACAGLSALALPATAALFSRFPRRGAGLALPVALAVVGVVAFWVGRISFGYVSLLAGVGAIAGLSAVALYRGVELDRGGYAEAMVVFGAAFSLVVAIRAMDPAVHPGGGEKFLDFGLLASLARSPTLPPEDMWFAGNSVQYYYGGHMIASLLSDLTLTPPRYAYNLALATFFGTAVTAAYALAGAMADARDLNRRSAGLFGAFFVGIASNLLSPTRALVWLFDLRARFVELDPGDEGLDDLVASGLAGGPGEFSYWDASRIIDGTINEFPFFGYLNGDLHAHMTNMGFVLLAAAVVYAYWRTPASAIWRRRAIVFGLVPPLAGLVAVVNTWSLPTVLGLAWLGVLVAPASPVDLLGLDGLYRRVGGGELPRADGGYGTAERPETAGRLGDLSVRSELVRGVTALAVVGVLAVLAVVVVLPYMTGTTSGRQPAITKNESTIFGLLLVHGTFLALSARYLLPRVDPGAGNRLPAAVAVLALTALAQTVGLLHVVPLVVLLVLGWLLLRAEGDVGYETALVVAALGLVVLVEFVFVSGRGNPTRYNTVFKTYADVWILWGTAAGAILAAYANPAGFLARLRPSDGDGDGDGPTLPSVGGVLAAILVVSLSLYAGLAVANLAGDGGAEGPATLDSLQFVERYHSMEADAIQFVRDREGQPNIVTAPTRGGDMYRWAPDWKLEYVAEDEDLSGGSAPSSLTGVPTIAGWQHEVGYRGRAPWDARVEDVGLIYDGTARQQVFHLDYYRVEYVYVGPVERHRYENTNFAERLTGVSVAYEDEHVTIYEVDREELGVAGE
jgi:YYY domain-containing protein